MGLKLKQGTILFIALLGLIAIGVAFWFVMKGNVAQAPSSVFPEEIDQKKDSPEISVPDLNSIEPSGKLEDTVEAAALEVTLESGFVLEEQNNISEILDENQDLNQINNFYSQEYEF